MRLLPRTSYRSRGNQIEHMPLPHATADYALLDEPYTMHKKDLYKKGVIL